VKTAIAGGDANWGRIVMAVGKAGEAADRDKLKISFGNHVVADKGSARRSTTKPCDQGVSLAPKSRFPSMSASARARRGSGPAT
jgi:N-acetylglutamate synthase/N-acetylornithine aminotransferase